MILLPAHKAVYVSCPRTGSHTMYAVLQERYGGIYHRPVGDPHCQHVPPECEDWFVFRTVRNPYARAVSIWRAMLSEVKYHMQGVPWSEFAQGIAGGRWRGHRITSSQHAWHFGNAYNETLHLERLDEEVARLPFWDGPQHVVPAANRTYGLPLGLMYMDEGETKAAVDKWAGPEFELYGYPRKIP